MNTLKFFFTIGTITVSCLNSYTQNIVDFDTFTAIFPKRDFPFRLSYDEKVQTNFTTPLPDIPQKLCDTYIFQNSFFESVKKDEICFSGFLALGRFLTTNYNLLLLVVDGIVGCGEEEYLITYSKQGQIIDKLFVFGRTRKNGLPIFYQEAIIDSTAIVITREETLSSVREGDKFKNNIRVYDRIYHISKDGKFIKESERWKDDFRYWK